jgi:hypothetical protein
LFMVLDVFDPLLMLVVVIGRIAWTVSTGV